MLGVGKVYSQLDEAVAAITVQRRFRELLRARGFQIRGYSPYYRASARSRSSTIGGRRRAGTEVQISFVRRINLLRRNPKSLEHVQAHCCRACERSIGLFVYMLSLGFFCK